MNAKPKISIRKVLQVLFTLVVTGGCVMAMLSASRIENGKNIKGITIQLKNDKYHFLTSRQIMDILVNSRHVDINHLPAGKLDIHSMEGIIGANPWVADAQIFMDNDRIVHVYVTQRVPVARVFEDDGASYYLDTALNAMPLSGNYVYYTTVVTNVPELRNDSLGRSVKGEIISLVKYIEQDTFWNAQVAQIIMDTDRTFELVPVMGDQRIILGDTSSMKDKFNNLFIFYKQVLNRIGWERYRILDLRYKGQVVASPSLPYKGPVDKVANSMSWVKSIIESSKGRDEALLDTAQVRAEQNKAVKINAAPQPKQPPAKPVVKTAASVHEAEKNAMVTKAKVSVAKAKVSVVKNNSKIKNKLPATADKKKVDKRETVKKPSPKYIYHQ